MVAVSQVSVNERLQNPVYYPPSSYSEVKPHGAAGVAHRKINEQSKSHLG